MESGRNRKRHRRRHRRRHKSHGGVDLVAGGQADLFIYFFQREADGVFFGLLEIDVDIVLIDKFLDDPLSRAEISAASAGKNGQKAEVEK